MGKTSTLRWRKKIQMKNWSDVEQQKIKAQIKHVEENKSALQLYIESGWTIMLSIWDFLQLCVHGEEKYEDILDSFLCLLAPLSLVVQTNLRGSNQPLFFASFSFSSILQFAFSVLLNFKFWWLSKNHRTDGDVKTCPKVNVIVLSYPWLDGDFLEADWNLKHLHALWLNPEGKFGHLKDDCHNKR